MTSPDRLALSRPLDPPSIPTVEIASTTRREEARSAVATAAAMLDRGVPVRDVALVARDLDTYEEPLSRAAIRYGVTPVFWTQIRLSRTRPYGLVESVCRALAGGTLDRDELLRPLELRWVAPDWADEGDGEDGDRDWPIAAVTLECARLVFPDRDASRPIDDWVRTLEEADVDSRIPAFARWLRDVPDPRPDTIESVLGGMVDAYADHALPVTRAEDSPALLETETDARAVVRVRTLVRQLGSKLADRIAETDDDPSWGDVADLANTIATQRPGRREHSNARAVDVFEANDVWALDLRYVIAVGLTDGEWPAGTSSTLPPEFREAVLAGEGAVGTLAPRLAWTHARDRDQFLDTLGAATDGVVVTRHTRNADGDEVHPSPLLEHLDRRTVSEPDRRRLVGSEGEGVTEFPAELRGLLPEADPNV